MNSVSVDKMSVETPYPDGEVGELTCKPLKTLAEVAMFLEDPPPWKTMCKELTPHSEFKIINMEVINHSEEDEINVDDPEIFCHLSSQNQETEDPIRHDGSKLPKTLLCHDMAGGYHDDCYIDGTRYYDRYTFYNWAGIDIFCYFSHHLITIPPLGWINVAHAHGVKVIGTVITERLSGMTFWDKLLQSETEYQNFANSLVAIAKTLKFEGWLLNIENKISQPEVLVTFVQYLHRVLHAQIPNAELIWYDSVTVTGNLNWQNSLNNKNRAFFDACDGIFTNYSWNVDDLDTSARQAGERLTDLYIGIDVWGRNFFGGGEFSTQEALKLVYERQCSIAIFAPAWTHEAMTLDMHDVNYVMHGEQLDPWQRFLLRDRALWDSLWPFLYTRLPAALPFRSSFCKGQGRKRKTYGEVISHGPWYNLRCQQYQPNSLHGPHGYELTPHDVILAKSRMAILEHRGIIKITEPPKLSHSAISPDHRHAVNYLDRQHSVNYLEASGRQHFENYQDPSTRQQAADHPDLSERELAEGQGTAPSDRRYSEGYLDRVARQEFLDYPEHSGRRHSADSPVARDSGLEIPSHSSSSSMCGIKKFKEMIKKVFSKSKIRRDGLDSASSSTRDLPTPDRNDAEEDDRASDAEPKDSEVGLAVSALSAARDRQSMLAMSLNLRLGQGRATSGQRMGLLYAPDDHECLEVHLADSFEGGSSQRVCAGRLVRLLHCEFSCRDSLVVCVVTKPLPAEPNQWLNVKLRARAPTGFEVEACLVGRDTVHSGAAGVAGGAAGAGAGGGALSAGAVRRVAALRAAPPEPRLCSLQAHLLHHEPAFYVPLENPYGWRVRYYEVSLPGLRLTSINLLTGLKEGDILLGHLALCHGPVGGLLPSPAPEVLPSPTPALFSSPTPALLPSLSPARAPSPSLSTARKPSPSPSPSPSAARTRSPSLSSSRATSPAASSRSPDQEPDKQTANTKYCSDESKHC